MLFCKELMKINSSALTMKHILLLSGLSNLSLLEY